MKIGIDLGGSHIGIGLVGPDGTILLKEEKDILAVDKENIENFLEKNIVEIINKVLKKSNVLIDEIEMIGIASPGTIVGDEILNAVNLNIENFKIVEVLKKYFDVPMKIKNDGKCSAICEKKFGSLKKYDDAVFICLGTGIGGAVFLNGELLQPKRYSGFELGHMTILKNGIACSCGKNGCFERYASMKVLKSKIIEVLNLDEDISGKELLDILKNNLNLEVEAIINKYIENLVIGIANLIDIFEPEAICIGGSFIFFKDILFDKLMNRMKQKGTVFNKGQLPKIVLATMKNDTGIIGAAMQ